MPLTLIPPKKEIRKAASVGARIDGMEPTTSQRALPVALSLFSKHTSQMVVHGQLNMVRNMAGMT